jgi:UDP-N-acetylmuramate dehydrogenase
MDDIGDIYTIQSDNAEFGYRHSIFKKNNYIILSVIIQLKLVTDIMETPNDKIKRYMKKKKESQPVNTINAGSVFKNIDIPSWEIIDKLGYRGYVYNDAKINEKHANFIENLGNASYDDMIYIINMIKKEAKEKLNVDMECEWEIIE